MDENIRRAIEIVESGVHDVRKTSMESAGRAHSVFRSALEQALTHLEAGERAHSSDPDDVFSSLDRKSQNIAEDLRRAERLMRDRGAGPD